ncbi:hypothetical protein PBY51_010941 [Eleginops maclovinus]|uniref:LIM zinc-binding domain-containing protein n=1 Tax=Eleginops maclovinus TaxID=56733 RepID=A0AAN7XBK4_ELEMC|nr:hypothetical protein PBY51_010941 [Eleginops maclovinus]
MCIKAALCLHSSPRLFCLSCAAEKVSSLGKDWHKMCLKCDRCNKLLNAGGHAEVSGTPQVLGHQYYATNTTPPILRHQYYAYNTVLSLQI